MDVPAKCVIAGSSLCEFAGCDGCTQCAVHSAVRMDQSERRRLAQDWEVTLSLLPDDVDALHQSKTCLFCNAHAADRFALVELTHNEPVNYQFAFSLSGIKRQSCVGSYLLLPIACCKKCAHTLRLNQAFGALARPLHGAHAKSMRDFDAISPIGVMLQAGWTSADDAQNSPVYQFSKRKPRQNFHIKPGSNVI